MASTTLRLSVAICKSGHDGRGLHWILVLAEQGAKNGTWYHTTGGPSQNKDYEVVIRTKKTNSHGIESLHPVADISEADRKKVKASAQKVPAKACQAWALDVLADLEKKGLVPTGTHDTWCQFKEREPMS